MAYIEDYCFPLKVFDGYEIRAGFTAWNPALILYPSEFYSGQQ